MDFSGSQAVRYNRQRAQQLSSSFRDPSGFLFTRDGALYRQINLSYRDDYDHLLASGLYDELTDQSKLVAHQEVDISLALERDAYRVIKPNLIPFVSYPYEWSFSQLKDAALLTLRVAERAVSFGMILKDATAYNVQFINAKPIMIDTLSFGKYEEGTPWVAYRQFCQHFLAPLALMSLCDVSLAKLFETSIDGVSLPLAAKLLPWRSKFRFQLYLHIHLHAKSQVKYASSTLKRSIGARKISKNSLLGLFDGLRSAINGLDWQPHGTEWGNYYEATNYSSTSMQAKKALVENYVSRKSPATVWDLGANTGVFSRIAAARGASVVSFDIDPAAVEKNYRALREQNVANILPLVSDLTNPSPAIGWASSERSSLIERGPADMLLALALVHHLAISNNIPLESIAKLFARLSKHLVIEFVPKSDSQVIRLLASRPDIFSEYSKENFERIFEEFFVIEDSRLVSGSERTIYLMSVRNSGFSSPD